MKLKIMTAVVLAVAQLSSTTMTRADIEDGPFGITMGSDPASYGCISEDSDGFFTCDNPPRMHPDIKVYVVLSTPKTGICWVKGMGKPLDTNSYGSSLQVSADNFAEQLAKIYGHYELDDYLLYDSIWKDSGDWMMGLLKGERRYTYYWDKDTNADLKNGIDKIYASARALSSGNGYVAIEFYFSNYDECQKERQASKAGAF